MTRYKRIYRMLINYGHSGAKALEIILDAKRGDFNALFWIKGIWFAHRFKRGMQTT